MKKLLAIVLALMLLTASVAFAETATVTTFSNAQVTVTQNGQTSTIDLAGLTLTVAAGLVGEEPQANEMGELVDTRVPTIQLDIAKDGAAVVGAELQIIDNRIVIDVDGLSRPLAVDMSMAGDVASNGYRTLFASMPEAAASKLPAFTGVNIPKIDLSPVASYLPMLGAQVETTGNTTSFEIPAEAITMLLQMVLMYVPAETLQSSGISDSLNEMLSGGGFALKGDITDDGTTASLAVGVYPVQNGATAAEPSLVITFASAENSDSLTVDMLMGGQSMTLGEFVLTSIPDAAELDASLNLMGGMVDLAFSLYPQDDAQVVALELNAQGQKITASLVYGEHEGAGYTDFNLVVDGQAAIGTYVETVADGNGNETGIFELNINSYNEPQTDVVIQGDLDQTVQEGFTFRSIANVANAIDANSMTEEESAQVAQEFQAILANLMGALGDIAPAA